MPRYVTRTRRPYQGDQSQELGPQDAEDADDQQQPRGGGGGVRARNYKGGAGSRGTESRQPYRGKTKEGLRGYGKQPRYNNHRGGNQREPYKGNRNYQDNRGQSDSYRGNRRDDKQGSWRGPNKNFHYATQGQGQGKIPVITSTPLIPADAGNGRTNWGSSGSYEQWDNGDDNYYYEDDGYQQEQCHDDQSWEVDNNSHNDSYSRQPYNREVDEGGKRKSQNKPPGKVAKKARIEPKKRGKQYKPKEIEHLDPVVTDDEDVEELERDDGESAEIVLLNDKKTKRTLKPKSVQKKAKTAPLPKDEDVYMDSDHKEDEEAMEYDHKNAEAENDVLKKEKKSFKMKAMSSRVTKSLKISKEKPKRNTQKPTENKDPKKVKSEMAVEMKTNPKIKTKDATKYQSDDTHAQENNVGVHDISSSPGNLDEDYEFDGNDKTTKMKGTGLKMVDVKTGRTKDKLFTKPSGDVVRRDNYVIPKISRPKTKRQTSPVSPELDLSCVAPELKSMKNGAVNATMLKSPMSKKVKNGAEKSDKGNDRGPDEVLSPKPRIMREPRVKMMRTVTFAEPSPNKSIDLEQSTNRDAMDALDAGKIESLNKEVYRLDKLVKIGLNKIKQTNIKHEQVLSYITGKGNNMQLIIEDLDIKLKIARESEEEFKIKNIELKKKLSKSKSQVTILTENSKNYEWDMQLIKAQLSGAEAKEVNNGNEPDPKVNIKNIVALETEMETCKARIEVLESDAEEDQRTITTLERALSIHKKEVKRLNLADVKYKDLLEVHHGGSLRKHQEFMKTANLAEDCSTEVVTRWRKLNSWRLDEREMLMLTKLIVSERVIRSKAIIIDFLKMSLEFEPKEGEIDETPNAPVKKEKADVNFLLITPEKLPKKKKPNQNPSAYQDAYNKHILLTHETNQTEIYGDLNNFPDLREPGHGKTEPEYTWLDMSRFDEFRTGDNDKAVVVRTPAGGYLSQSNCMSQRRHCFPHQYQHIKACEIPGCSRFIFPQSHRESELIGRVNWISGASTMMLTQGLKVREFGMLYGCLLCVLRSQSPDKARQKLKDMKIDVDMKKARDAEERQVKGISMVIDVKNDGAKDVTKRRVDGAVGLGDDDECEANLLAACSPKQMIIRQGPLTSRKAGRDVPKASVKRSLQESYPGISINRISDAHEIEQFNQDHARQCTSFKPITSRTSSTENELNKIFDDDSLSLANSLNKNSLIRNFDGLRSRLTGASVSPNSNELIEDGHIEDFNGEVFSSGNESFEEQMREIHEKFGKKRIDDTRVDTVNDTIASTGESNKPTMRDINATVLNMVETMNSVLITGSEALDEHDDEAGQDDDREESEQTNEDLLCESNVSDDELQNESDSSQVLQDAQSMGVHSDDGGDEDVEDGVDDEVEGYVPQPLNEQQVSDMRDRGDQ